MQPKRLCSSKHFHLTECRTVKIVSVLSFLAFIVVMQITCQWKKTTPTLQDSQSEYCNCPNQCNTVRKLHESVQSDTTRQVCKSEMFPNILCDAAGYPFHREQPIQTRSSNRLNGTKMLQKCLFPFRTKVRNFVKHRNT